MSDKSAKKVTEPTLDGKRLRLHELNLGVSGKSADDGRVQRFLRNLSQFLAGMYTGESCAGTPHSERTSTSSTSNKQNAD